ncbi:hypothetical protein LSH36_195g07006 [Paralvinella palmiformis]|uniref:Uncharacterized protein n=1 Tax=Paralvinella palmiformis TaxID=53620 RepID=A0AAD9N7S2_9ANNE|nr:hypothetical protein LSH36_195g07006 [Paralvinella palmiformis]
MNINKILILTVFVTEELPCTFTKISLIRKRELKSVTRLELTLIRTQRSVDMADDRTQYEELHRFQELFHGRFLEHEAAFILHKFQGLINSVKFVLFSEPAEVQQVLEEERNTWTTVRRKVQRLRREQRSILDKARSGRIDTRCRLFSCAKCDEFWWRRTPSRKQVSRCRRCRTRYNAVPHDREWGWAEFHYLGAQCIIIVRVLGVDLWYLPHEFFLQIWAERNREETYTFAQLQIVLDVKSLTGYGTVTCVHPRSRLMRGLPKVITSSVPHDSTGSTVDTFLSQTDPCKPYDEYFHCLPTIDEDHSGDNVPDSSRQ